MSLKARQSELASSPFQLKTLASANVELFASKLRTAGLYPLRPTGLEVLQINLGKMCNQSCAHCHVDAGPDRKEIMSRKTMQECLEVVDKANVKTADLTGGAPEMNPHFRWFVQELTKRGVHVIDRCNLTILLANAEYADLPLFFREHQVEIISSLPHYTSNKTDRQRGQGVFKKSIIALKKLNEVGYGAPDGKLKLNLVYNPAGAFLPGDQSALEQDFKRRLESDFGIQFHQLYTITNIPISRFLDYLLKSDNFELYMATLANAFNPQAAKGVMCRNMLSVGWDGQLYDCDFNQMLDLPIQHQAKWISDFSTSCIERDIVVNQHCYACTAGSGSSCGGATAP